MSNKELWRVAKTTIRSSYLPQADGLPGPGAYSPLVHGRGKPADLAVQAAQFGGHSPPRPKTAASSYYSPWPAEQTQRPTTQQRRRTLGDGTTMLMPAPGMAPIKPVMYKREPTLLKELLEVW